MGKRLDLTGQRFGRLVVLKDVGNSRRGASLWKCRCICKKIKLVEGGALKHGQVRSCGCLVFTNMMGQSFGQWTVLRLGYGTKKRERYWKCRCKCGTVKNVLGNSLRKGISKSCGCMGHPKARLPKGTASFNKLFLQYKQKSAKSRGYSFRVSKKYFQILTKQNCYYCGMKPSNIMTSKGCNGDYLYTGIDRVDNSKGYVEGNVVACCARCNYWKKAHSQKDFLAHVERIHKHQLNLSRRL